MLQMSCSCGRSLGDIQLDYERMISSIENNSKLSEDEKKEKKSEVLSKLHIERYCCRMRVMSYVDFPKFML